MYKMKGFSEHAVVSPLKRCWKGYKPNPDGRPASEPGSCVPDKSSPNKQKSTVSAHGQLSDAKRDYDMDKKRRKKATYENTAEDHAKQNPYWYKVDGKPVPKYVYNKYKNKPGKMEGGGKTTNDPDPAGVRAKRKVFRERLFQRDNLTRKPTMLTEKQTKNLKK
jgi:hypothetical protein|tara:strand:- start:459 stop:950 length:492 start_codon:yes stop_codon:yes gene_type:complete